MKRKPQVRVIEDCEPPKLEQMPAKALDHAAYGLWQAMKLDFGLTQEVGKEEGGAKP